jgi:dihydroxy-acid dehydratase
MTLDPRARSRVLLDGADRAAARSFFRAVGFTDEDLEKPLVGVAHCWIEITPCNFNHRKLAEKVKHGIRAAGGTAERRPRRLDGRERPTCSRRSS